jgi:hypothetical protein
MAGQTSELKVFITVQESACDECGEELGRHAWITLEEGKGALCLACADLDHLMFLPAGDAALTRRARKHSTLLAVVLKWSRARKRYERQGLLVEQAALERAEEECLEDAEFRARRREREAARRARLDQAFVASFAEGVLLQFSRLSTRPGGDHCRACLPQIQWACRPLGRRQTTGRTSRSDGRHRPHSSCRDSV